MKDFEEFWEYLLDCSRESDAWWLEDWLEKRKKDYDKFKPCENCGSKRSKNDQLWSATGNWLLEERTVCCKCKKVLSVKDRRDTIREALEEGAVRVKDSAVLAKEVGYGR